MLSAKDSAPSSTQYESLPHRNSKPVIPDINIHTYIMYLCMYAYANRYTCMYAYVCTYIHTTYVCTYKCTHILFA
jgi:hypothetical protein